jgi:hypothetical protein
MSNIVIISREPQNNVNSLKNQFGYHTSFAAATKSQKFKHMWRDDANDPSFKPFNDVSPWKKSNKSIMPMDDEEKEDFFYNTLEKMAILVEKLEKLFEKLYPHEPPENTQNLISSIVNASLVDSAPIGYIKDQHAYFNRLYHTAKIIKYVAKYYRTDTFAATEYLRSILLVKHML